MNSYKAKLKRDHEIAEKEAQERYRKQKEYEDSLTGDERDKYFEQKRKEREKLVKLLALSTIPSQYYK